jgi:hypothetical protein
MDLEQAIIERKKLFEINMKRRNELAQQIQALEQEMMMLQGEIRGYVKLQKEDEDEKKEEE